MGDDSEFRFEIEFLSGPDDGELKRLYSSEAIIGSESEADLVVACDTAAAGKHARIRCQADGFLIEDLGSDGGTFVNGEKIAEQRKFDESDVVSVGHTEFVCRASEPENVPSMTGSQGETAPGT